MNPSYFLPQNFGPGPSNYNSSGSSASGSGSGSATPSPEPAHPHYAQHQQQQHHAQHYAAQYPPHGHPHAHQHQHEEYAEASPIQTAPVPQTGPMILPHQDLQSFLESFWSRQMDTVEGETPDWKSYSLPLARIKKVMKSDEEVKMISAEAPIMFSKACEIFISELTCRAWLVAESHKRRTLQKSDVAAAIAFSDMFDFLIDIVPRDEGGAGGAPSGGAGNGGGSGSAGGAGSAGMEGDVSAVDDERDEEEEGAGAEGGHGHGGGEGDELYSEYVRED
ncbi:hypothetical protein IAT38_003487 [Cryptococcus sp. DSM 104549]